MEISIKHFDPRNEPEKSLDEKIDELFLKHKSIYIIEFGINYTNLPGSIKLLKESVDIYYKTLSGEAAPITQSQQLTYYKSHSIPGEGLISVLGIICLLGAIIGVIGAFFCFNDSVALGLYVSGCSLGCTIYYFFFKYLGALGDRIKDLEKDLHYMQNPKS